MTTPSMELKQLEHFVTVAREGGFAPAARALRLTQPSLTRSIAALETSLGTRLFDRRNRGATLNDAGYELLPHATAILQEAARARAKFASRGAESRRELLRIGVSPNLLFTVLPDRLRDLLGERDETAVVISTGTYESLTEGLRARDLDLVLCMAMTAAPLGRPRTDMAVHRFGDEDVLPVARAGHPVFDEDLSLATVARQRWAIPYQMSVSYRFALVFNEHNLPQPVQSLSSSSLSLVRRAIADWGLLGMLPRSMLTPPSSEGLGGEHAVAELRPLDVPELVLSYQLAALTNRAGQLPPAAAALLEALDARNGSGID